MNHINDLVAAWQTAPFRCIKISSYFPTYVQLFQHLRGQACTFIETGILDGGSLFMWRQWLGPQARIIGIDLNPDAQKWRQYGFEIIIGDQGDPNFWRAELEKMGNFDALLDDGGHQSFQQIVTLQEAIRNRKNKCVIAVEDTSTSFMKDFSCQHGNFSFLEFCKDATDCLVARLFPLYANRFPSVYNKENADFFQNVFSIQFFNGIVAFHIDWESCVRPELLQNISETSATDYRYEGKDHAIVGWPSILANTVVTVQGGR